MIACSLLLVKACLCDLGNELITARGMVVKEHSKLLSGFKSENWYFAKFKQVPSLGAINNASIQASSESIISAKWMKLFLTSEQASELIGKFGAELFEVTPAQKLVDCVSTSNGNGSVLQSEMTVEGVHLFDVECSPGFVLTEKGLHVEEIDPRHLRVGIPGSDSFVLKTLNEIASLDNVFSITAFHRAVPLNRWTGPFVQNNKNSVVRPDQTSRAINDKGLTGAGVTVLVADTGIDIDSTFFYDSKNIQIQADKVLDHRKVKYCASKTGECADGNGHGTHVAGTLAGNPVCQGCDEVHYPGIAKDAKLGILKCITETQQQTDATTQLDVMKKIDAHISSNSWGLNFGSDFFLRNDYDRAMYNSPDHLFVFAASASGSSLIESPASAKNVISVGSLAKLTESKWEQTRRINFVLQDDSSIEVTELVVPNSGPLTPIDGKLHLDFVIKDFFSDFKADVQQLADHLIAAKWAAASGFLLVTGWPGVGDGLGLDAMDFYWTNQIRAAFDPQIRTRIFVTCEKLQQEQLKTIKSLAWPVQQTPSTPTVAGISPTGATTTGIIKPEVVAPSEQIKSALGGESTTPGYEHLGLLELSGTSMATPLVSGSLALIEQYFKDGYYCQGKANDQCVINPGSCLLRSMIVASADPVESEYSTICSEIQEKRPDTRKPTGTSGFGSVSLQNVLPFEDSGFALHIVQDCQIKDGEHLVAKVKVTAQTRDLRIVMSYLDAPLALDSYASLAVDLDLFVFSPSKKVFAGNHNPSGASEHFSTIERVIVNANELEIGEYTIHVYCHNPYNLTSKFSVVSVGPTDKSQELEFKPASSTDYHCENGGTPTDTGFCKCPTGFWGPTCYVTVITEPDRIKAYLLWQNDPVRFSFDVPKSEKEVYLRIFHHISTGASNRHMLYLTTQNHDAETPIDYETITPYNQEYIMKVSGGTRITGMVVNLEWKCDIVSIFFQDDDSVVAGPTPTKESRAGGGENTEEKSTMSLGAGVAGWVIAGIAIAAVVVIVLLVFVCKGRGTTSYSDEQPQETIP